MKALRASVIHLLGGLVRALLLLAILAGSAMAQAEGEGAHHAAQAAIREMAQEANEFAKRVDANVGNDARLVEFRLELEGLASRLLATGVEFRPRLSEINARLEQLGPVPGDGAPPEPEIVAEERLRLTEEKAQINALIGEAESASLRVNRLIDRIAQLRRDLFSNTLSKRYDLDFGLVFEVVKAFESETARLYRTFSSWLNFVIQFKLHSMLVATFLALAAAAVLSIGGRRLFGQLFEADPLREAPSYLSRLSVAFWATLLPTAALAVFFATTLFLYNYFTVLRGDIGRMLSSLFAVTLMVFFVYRLAKAALAPGHANWRLIPVSNESARLLLWLVFATAFVTGVDYFLSDTYEVMNAPLSLTVGESLVATIIVGILVILIALVKPLTDAEGRARTWPLSVRCLLHIVGFVTIVAALLGYIGLSRFISQQIVITGAVLATMYIGFLSAQAISEEGAFAQTALGRRFVRWFEAGDSALDQAGLAISIGINVLVVLIGVPLILFQWGFQPGDIQGWVYRLLTGFTIGTITISITGILTGLIVFVMLYLVTRWFQGWLDGKVMVRGRVDAGVRNSIKTAVGYSGIALAALVGISAAGIDLSNLALVAGALSLGIGFGLQNVVSNFVSGLILLVERPFKAGDWIVAGAVSGTVKKISVRATEIETFQRQTVILPNSELINAAVGNWTHKNKLGRVEIPIGIGYGSNAKLAHEILLDIARNHPLVLKNPEPFVLFAGFGDSSLDFEIRLFLSDIMNGVTVQNDVRFAILERFEAEGIEIPFPQRTITIRSEDGAPVEPEALQPPPEPEMLEPPMAEEPPPKPVAATRRRKGRRRPDPD